ncbi:hypothetical protein LPTSP4_22150 [Leptospira ryugenii]|uniref:Uncharacterized protein n=1 Tax=Leptospira ryugenii TaxID=1917863 RepID=A0A2P2E1B9_9LEPT|nr:efflux RND transporter periplasmic adaptor subunit [Leptospira ryugenii]GBF50688.1 hypothetical protein LPTSP4_22150 [Leptospira ryugenii]
MNWKSKPLLVLFGILGILLLSLLIFRSSKKETIVLKKGSLVEVVYALGTVKPEKEYSLKFGISAAIKEIYVSEGKSVQKGEALIKNDSGIIFRAPFSGTVTNLNLSDDELVMPGISILKILDMDDLYILVSLDQESAMRIRPKQIVQFSFESVRGHTYSGIVDRVYPSQGQFMVRVNADLFPDGILPDMTADVAIQVADKKDVLLVPIKSISKGKVIRYRDGKKEKVSVKLGAINSEFGELLEGDLKENDEVVLGIE